MSQRVVMVTGATGAIGEAIARGLAEDRATRVVLACRDAGKAERVCRRIRSVTGNDAVDHETVDVSKKASIEALGARWSGRLDALVNNAAIAPRRRTLSAEGVELQLATNVLGYGRMTSALLDALAQAAPSIVVNVASYWAGDLDLSDLEFERRRYDNDEAYRQSKQANRMLSVAYAERLESRGVFVNACHPGDVNSKLSADLGFGGHQSPEEGARTPVWLVNGGAGAKTSGRYFAQCRERACQFASDRAAIEELFGACAVYG